MFTYSRRGTRKKARMTTTEYFQTPETVLPRELAFGVLRAADAPSPSHQRMVRDLTVALTMFAREHHAGEVFPAPIDVVLDFDKALVVQPDVVFLAAERSDLVADRIYGAPDLVIEVLSPNPRIGRLEDRIGWFAQYGVHECWLVNLAAKQIVVLKLTERGVEERLSAVGNYEIPTSVLDGLPLTPAQLFGW